jgi:hypothetical protein
VIPRRAVLLVLAVGLHAAAVAAPGLGRAAEPLIAAIDEKYDVFVDGCSCKLYERPGWDALSRPIFFSDIRGQNAWMNIAGTMELLALFRLEEPARPHRQGDRLGRRYWSRTSRVTCDLTVTSVCDGKSECDGFGVSATVSVVHGSQRVQMRAYGVCGC